MTVERQTELLGFEEAADACVARLRGPDGSEETCEAELHRRLRRRSLAGARGARHRLPRRHLRQLFYVADVEAHGPADRTANCTSTLDEADFLAVFPMAGEGRARLIGTVRDERAEHAPSTLSFERRRQAGDRTAAASRSRR